MHQSEDGQAPIASATQEELDERNGYVIALLALALAERDAVLLQMEGVWPPAPSSSQAVQETTMLCARCQAEVGQGHSQLPLEPSRTVNGLGL